MTEQEPLPKIEIEDVAAYLAKAAREGIVAQCAAAAELEAPDAASFAQGTLREQMPELTEIDQLLIRLLE